MPDTHANQPLSFMDAFFLYLEQPGAPINVASIGEFEGDIPFDLCVKFIQSKLPLIPRFLMRVAMPSFLIGSPTWQYDQNFDLHNHVREVTLKHGTEAEWKALVSNILSKHLDRSHPLWELTLVHGLKSGCTGVVVKVHHALVDGVAGVAMLKVLLDPNPEPPVIRRKKLEVPPPPALHEPAAILDTLINSCFSTAQAFLTMHSELLRMAEKAALPSSHPKSADPDHASVQQSMSPLSRIAPLGDLARLLSELAEPTQKLPFNKLSRGPQNFDWTRLSMDEIFAVKQACEATVNDVVLTTLSIALRRYAELHNIKVKGRKLRLVLPVNVRDESDHDIVGNQITFLPVDIPWNYRNPREYLSLVQRRVKFSKTAHGAELVGVIGMVLSALPTALQSITGNILSQLPISVCNAICTNVPGPKVPLYLMGHKMVASYPCVPRGGEMGMNCAVLSYDGALFVGFTGDAQCIPDIGLLAKLFVESFNELRDSVGVHIEKPRKSRRRKKVVAAEKSSHTRTRRVRRVKETPAQVEEAPAEVVFAETIEAARSSAVAPVVELVPTATIEAPAESFASAPLAMARVAGD